MKNVPLDKLEDMSHVNEVFKQYGQINSIHLDQRKRAATIKFKEIASAEAAAA